MDTQRAETLARELMAQHGLGHLRFEWHASNKAMGICHHVRCAPFWVWTCAKITLSLGLVQVNDEAIIRNTILHEIAHAKAGHKAGHGPLWKLAAIGVGAKPNATCGLGVNSVPTNIKAICPLCSQVHYFCRMPRKTKYCVCQKARLRSAWVGLNPERA
jgi:SprT protein